MLEYIKNNIQNVIFITTIIPKLILPLTLQLK